MILAVRRNKINGRLLISVAFFSALPKMTIRFAIVTILKEKNIQLGGVLGSGFLQLS